MIFNTAVFYDIENLIGGYGWNHVELLLHLSLKQINTLIQEKGYGKIGIKRAYADWSNPRLNQLKTEIVELGIEPKQLFAFGKASLKNASDIHLVVDVMEVLFSKPDIELFIIVSGDGGFSPLANKLHEYGKTVMGCAYRRQTNKLFEATTDEFIWLTDPLETVDDEKTFEIQPFSTNYLMEYAAAHKPLSNWDKRIALTVGREIADFMADSKILEKKMGKEGVTISVFFEMMKYRIQAWDYRKPGYKRAIDFLAEATDKSKLKLVVTSTGEHRLMWHHVNAVGYTDFCVYQATHTVANYRKILAEGSPVFRQFDLAELLSVSQYLCRCRSEFGALGLTAVTEKVISALECDSLSVMKSVTSLISAGCFRTPESKSDSVGANVLSFVPHTPDEVMEQIALAMQHKLRTQLKRVEPEVLKEVLK